MVRRAAVKQSLVMNVVQGVAVAAILGVLATAVKTYTAVHILDLKIQQLSEKVNQISRYEYRSKNFRRDWTEGTGE